MSAAVLRIPPAGPGVPVRPDGLRIAGVTRLSSVDWPDRLVATVFLQGCPWDCFYCHNPALIPPRGATGTTWAETEAFLRTRVGLLDGVVFSGGEPTMQHALLPAMAAVRALGLGVGLHTGGAHPRALERALPLVDWVGLDIKALPADYERVTGRRGGAERAWRSLGLVLAAQVARAGTDRPLDYEVRTTVHSEAVDEDDLDELAARLAAAGVRTWALQRFRPEGARATPPRVGRPHRPVDLARTLDGGARDGGAHGDRIARVVLR